MELLILFGFLGIVSIAGIIWGIKIISHGGLKDE